MSDPVAGLIGWIVGIVESLGYLGVALLVALENLITVIPSELVLPLAGFLAGQGRLWLPGVVAAATIGSVGGALVMYGLGYWLGEDRVRLLVRKHGRRVLVREADLDYALEWFRRHGATSVLFGRLVPAVRSLISIPAGISRMALGRFVIYTAFGSTVWNGVLVGLGWILGENWPVVREYARWLEYAVVVALATAVVWLVWRRVRTRR